MLMYTSWANKVDIQQLLISILTIFEGWRSLCIFRASYFNEEKENQYKNVQNLINFQTEGSSCISL